MEEEKIEHCRSKIEIKETENVFKSKKKQELMEKILEMIIWMQPIANIKPEYKVSDEGSLFSAFPNTLWGRIYRTLWTQDSGKKHAALILHKYREYMKLINECLDMDDVLDDDYCAKICVLLEKCAAGLNNLKEHDDYRNQSGVTSPLQLVIDFFIPQMIKQIKGRQKNITKNYLSK